MKEKLKEIFRIIEEADAILIGAGAGLSISAGFEYDGQTFLDNFRYMYDLYGYKDMYTAGFHCFDTTEEKWGYWSKFIYLNRYQFGPKALYKNLFQFVKNKEYFVLTTNVDHQFQLSGFDKQRLFYTQGDYGLFQCSVPCHHQTYDNEFIIKKMVKEQVNNKIPTHLIPKCPICNREMTVNLRCDETFVEDDGWIKASKNYQCFIDKYKNKKIVYLELGVGFNTPGIIKYNFWQHINENSKAIYICVNKNEVYIPNEIQEKSYGLKQDIGLFIKEIMTINNKK